MEASENSDRGSQREAQAMPSTSQGLSQSRALCTGRIQAQIGHFCQKGAGGMPDGIPLRFFPTARCQQRMFSLLLLVPFNLDMD